MAPKLVNVIPPSPNVTSLQSYGDIPVSAYTGIPNILIPIYTIKYKDITIPLSINYHASGIKVAEDASQVGLGWMLNAGGVISRNIIGGDDMLGQTYFNGTSNTIKDFADGQGPISNLQEGCLLSMYNRSIPGSPTLYTTDLTSYLAITNPPYDFEPDHYFYNFPGHSGKFILKRNKQAVLERQEKIDITLTTTSSAINNSWQIKSDDGFVYDFNQLETYSGAGTPSDAHNTAWYLTKITSATGNSVTFNYSINPNKLVTAIGSYAESTDAAQLPVTVGGAVFFSTNMGTHKGMSPARNYTHIALSSIDFTNGIVQFHYSDNRLDLPGDQRLDSISVLSKSTQGSVTTALIKRIGFSYTYFSAGDLDNDYMAPGAVGADANYKRLKLTHVAEKGYYNNSTLAQPPYVFSYFEGGILNMPSKASFARDHWGYYNGKLSNTSLIPGIIHVNSPDYITYLLGAQGPERDTDPAYLKAFTLSSIKYPTGGSTDFDYEANDYDEQRSMVNDHSSYNQQQTLVTKTQLLVYDNKILKGFSNDTVNLSDEYTNY